MRIRSLSDGGFSSNCYLLLDDREKLAIVIDPSVPFTEAKDVLGDSARITAIVLTHAHADHVLCLEDWRRETGAPVLIGEGDDDALSDPARNCSLLLGLGAVGYGRADRLLREGDRIELGAEHLTVLASPGHTPGSICLLSGSHLISGDTVFAYGGVGRTDFISGSPRLLDLSLRRLLSLPSDTVVYPGHGPITTVANERRLHLHLFP